MYKKDTTKRKREKRKSHPQEETCCGKEVYITHPHLHEKDECACVSTGSRFLYPSLLLLLAEGKTYGYDLISRLTEVGFLENAPDPASVYRVLRRLEFDGAVKSEWDTSGSGPAKRLYSITQEGVEILRGWGVSLRKMKESLDRFLETFQKRFGQF